MFVLSMLKVDAQRAAGQTHAAAKFWSVRLGDM